MTPSHHLTSKHCSWWYIVSDTRIWPGKKAVTTREPCRGGHDLGMNISTSLDHNPIFWTHHEKVTCWNEVKQQHICAFFLSRGPEKRRHKKVKSSHQVKQSEAHPPLPSMSCTPEQTKGNKPVQKRWCIQSSRQNSNQGNFTAIQYILLELPHGRIVSGNGSYSPIRHPQCCWRHFQQPLRLACSKKKEGSCLSNSSIVELLLYSTISS